MKTDDGPIILCYFSIYLCLVDIILQLDFGFIGRNQRTYGTKGNMLLDFSQMCVVKARGKVCHKVVLFPRRRSSLREGGSLEGVVELELGVEYPDLILVAGRFSFLLNHRRQRRS